MGITEALQKILGARYGREVRQAIHDGIERTYEDAIKNGNANMEVSQARGSYPSLGKRLDETDNKQRQTTAQLAKKLNKGEVSVSDINKNMGKFDQTYMSDEFLQQVAGNTPINAIPADNSITLHKTTFYKIGKNLFDKSKAETDRYIASNGSTYSLIGYDASDWIPIEPNTAYAFQRVRLASWYDSNKTHISQVSINDANSVRTSPKNATYVRFGLINTSTPLAQMEKGEFVTSYEPFRFIIPSMYVEKFNISESDIPDSLISPKKTNFIQNGKNLFDKSKAADGYYVDQRTGELTSNALHFASDFIPIQPNTDFVFSNRSELRVCFYSPNKSFISGVYNPVNGTVASPTGAAYLKFSDAGIPGKDSQQLEVGTMSTTFEAYGLKIPLLLENKEEEEIIINLPSKIYALVGQELNIYFDNIVSGIDKDYLFDVGATGGQQYEQFYRLTPITSGNHSLSLTIYKDSKPIKTVSAIINVSSKLAGDGVTKSVLILGDSTTNNGIVATKLNENFSTDVMNIELIGSRGTGLNKHEGRSGWTARQYVSVASTDNGTVLNPFYNPTTQTFDFAYYKSQTGFTNPDYFIINLGINDTFGQTTDDSLNTKMNEIIDDFTKMINSIKSVSGDIKIGIAITIPPNYSQDAFAKAYGVGQTRWRYKRNNVLWCKKLIETYQDREAENIYLIPIHLNIDTRNNYGFIEEPISKRNPTVVSRPIGNGGVHPVDSGYWQIADSYWFWLKSFES